jgi:hypothetical protein
LYQRSKVSPVRYERYTSCLNKKDRRMDNVQNCDSYMNIPSSQTYRSHYAFGLLAEKCVSCEVRTLSFSGFKCSTRRWIISRIVIVILIYHPHKPRDLSDSFVYLQDNISHLLHIVKMKSGVKPVSYLMCKRDTFPGINRPER